MGVDADVVCVADGAVGATVGVAAVAGRDEDVVADAVGGVDARDKEENGV